MDINNSFNKHCFKKFWILITMCIKIDYNSNKNPGPIFSKEDKIYLKGKANSFSKVKMFLCSKMYLDRN